MTFREQERSGRVLDSRPKGHGFEPYRRHSLWSLSMTHLSLLGTGSTRKTCPYMTERLLMGRKESNQTNIWGAPSVVITRGATIYQ